MKNKINSPVSDIDTLKKDELQVKGKVIHSLQLPHNNTRLTKTSRPDFVPGILFITSYPPRECGIATYSQDMIKALNNKFSNSFSLKVCALESGDINYKYPDEVKFVLKTSEAVEYKKLALKINQDELIQIVLIQHEFGFYHEQEESFLQFLDKISKPVVIIFHTVLPRPDEKFKLKVQRIAEACGSIVVMTQTSASILTNDYAVPEQKISVIAHGTHLVQGLSKKSLKLKYGLKDRRVLSTFGLLSSGKSIETTIDALPAIVKKYPEVVFLVMGKTHPEVVNNEGEKYREMLEEKVKDYALQNHVIFINKYLALPELLEYLQLTDIYLFTTNDPNQAVSGTFAYAMSCSCPIISTPIPHAKEVLTKATGIIIDFRNSQQLADAVNRLLKNDKLRRNMSTNALQNIVSTAWENSAIAHAMLFGQIASNKIKIKYNFPAINLDHLRRMTTKIGIIQFSRVNQPDISTGYTLDDNARALVAACMYIKATSDRKILLNITKYLSFIAYCQQPTGDFLNYVDKRLEFTPQNDAVNLDDSNGRAIWALGYVVSLTGQLPAEIIAMATTVLERALLRIGWVYSPRSMAFAIKGIYYSYGITKSPEHKVLLITLADRLVQMYKHESGEKWEWFENSLTYANSTLSEAMLFAWLLTGDSFYKEIAVSSLKFLLSQTFNKNGIEVISNKKWLKKGQEQGQFGEQPIDVAYTIMTLSEFYKALDVEDYRLKMETAFNWFLGKNRLHQIIYNPCTGGCFDGLEESHVNLNQGAESTVSYLMARLTMEKFQQKVITSKKSSRNHIRVHSVNKKPVYSTDNEKQPDQSFSFS